MTLNEGQARRAGTIAAMAVLLMLGGGAVPAVAVHNPEITTHCTYEAAGSGDLGGEVLPDPTGVTADGFLNVAGCQWEFRPSETHPLLDGVDVSGEYSSLQVSIVDDVFSTDVAGRACNDFDGNLICGDGEDEFVASFCGTSAVVEAPGDSNGDGHPDFGVYMAVIVGGPVVQALTCGSGSNPVGGVSGGVLDPAGGMFLTMSG